MSELEELTAAGRSDLIPGYVISPPRLEEIGELETEFARRYLTRVTLASQDLPPDLGDKLIDRALGYVGRGNFHWGMTDYDAACFASGHLPFLLYVSLRVKHPKITREQAAALIPEDRDKRLEIRRAILEKLGFKFNQTADEKKDDGPKVEAKDQTGGPSTGDRSSDPSAAAA